MPHYHRGGRGGYHKQNEGDGPPAPIPKAFYETVRRQIDEFKVGASERLVFDPMESHQRKVVHDMANRLRVISKSYGDGATRHCVISRRPATTMTAASNCSESEPVALTKEQKAAIVEFISANPISEEDIEDHVTVSGEGDHVRESRKFQGPRAEPQIPPAANPSDAIMKLRGELPAFHAKQQVLHSIENNKVILITGGTGCGKTTQVPQFLLERATESKQPVRIIVTQPRRLPAIAVAQRVALERREPMPATVGYHIRLEQRTRSDTVLTYCTSGVLLRMLTQDELAKDCTHIVLDEVHEREQNTDYLLIALKQALRKRSDLKVILMSATMEGNLAMFLNYFQEYNISHVDIKSRLFPVTNYHLADVMALTGYTPPESIYSSITSFSNGFGGDGKRGPAGGFGLGGGGYGSHSNGAGGGMGHSFSVGNWAGSSSSGAAPTAAAAAAKDTFASATTWNNSDAKLPPQSYLKTPLTPSNSLASSVHTATSSTAVAAAAAAGGGVRAVQSAANLPSYGNGGGTAAAATAVPPTAKAAASTSSTASVDFMSLASKLANAGGSAAPAAAAPNPLAAPPSQMQQQAAAAAVSSSSTNGMHRSASVNYAAQQQQQQYGQQMQQTYGSMQQQQGGGPPAAASASNGTYYGQQLSWDSPSGYADQSCDVVDLPMDDDDKHLTYQANQQLYNNGSYQQQQPLQQPGFGQRGNMQQMQPMQQAQQQYQSGNGYAGYNQQPQPMYMQQSQPPLQQQQYHQQPAAASSNHSMYHYNHYQSQPNMQLHQSQQQQQWSQQPPQQAMVHQQQQQQQSQPMFYVPDSSATAATGFFVQQNTGPMQQQQQSAASSSFHRSTSAAATLNEVEQFGMSLKKEESVRQSMVSQIQNMMPLRPPTFCSEAIEALESARHVMDRRMMTQFYRSSGGAQWEESVDVELALVTIRYLMDSPIKGAILVFLPGYEDIQALREKLIYDRWPDTRPSLCLLHSQLNSNDQQRVFEQTKPGERKVILSTNIAEASLTIDDVVFVVDCGKAKEKTYDHASRISQLKCVWIAKSNAEQRRGRAGRCRPGYCFRLYSDEEFDAMLPSQIAEMQRSAIHDVCLHAKMFAPERMSVKEFLQLAPEPPEMQAVDSSLAFLEQLGALYTEDDGGDEGGYGSMFRKRPEPELTQLGRLVAHLPLDPQLARLLLFGYALRCLNPIVTLVALLSHRDPFTLATGDEKQAALAARDLFARRDFSDHLMILRAFTEYHLKGLGANQIMGTKDHHQPAPEQTKLCRDKYLSAPTLKMVNGIRRQLLLELRRIRFISDLDAIEDPFLNEYSNNWPMVQAAIVAGAYPCIGFVKGSKMRKIRTYTDSHSQLHPSSSLKRQMLSQEKRQEALQKYYQGEPTIEYLAFQEFVKIEEGLTIRTATAIPSVTIFLFAGPIRLCKEKLQSYFISSPEEELQEDEGETEGRDFFQPRDILELESWLSVKGRMGDFIRLMQLRFKVMDYLLAVMRNPPAINERENKDLLSTLSTVLEIEHTTKGFNQVTDVYDSLSCRLQRAANGGSDQSAAAAAKTAAEQPRAEGYDFGATTSSSSHSHKGEIKRKPEPPQQSQYHHHQQQHYNSSTYYHNSNSTYHHKQYRQSPPLQQQQQQHRQQLPQKTYESSNGQQQQKETLALKGQRERDAAIQAAKEIGRKNEAHSKLNWREQQQQHRQKSATPPPKQVKNYPDPYRDKAREKKEHDHTSSNWRAQQQQRQTKNEQQQSEHGNGYGREERNEQRNDTPQTPKWKEERENGEKRRGGGNTVGARFAEKRGSRSSADDYGSSSNRYQGGSGRNQQQPNQQRYDDEDGGSDKIPEDPLPREREHTREERGGGRGGPERQSGGCGSQRRTERYSTRHTKEAAVEEEEDWEKNANAPHFFSTEGGNVQKGKKGREGGGRTFVNTNFSNKNQFKGMHSDRMESGRNGGAGGSRDDDRDTSYTRPRTNSKITRGD